MNTTCDIFPASLRIVRADARAIEAIDTQPVETLPQTAPDSAKSAFPWDAMGALLVLMIAMALVGLWSWTLVEFLRFFVETMPQPNVLEIVLR